MNILLYFLIVCACSIVIYETKKMGERRKQAQAKKKHKINDGLEANCLVYICSNCDSFSFHKKKACDKCRKKDTLKAYSICHYMTSFEEKEIEFCEFYKIGE